MIRSTGLTPETREPLERHRLLDPIPDACWLTGLGRSKMYELLAAGEIESVKCGKSRLVVHESLVAFVERLRQQTAS